MVIEIPYAFGNFTLKIVNDFLNCPLLKNSKKQVLFWNLKFDIVFDIDKHYNNFEKNISNEFENELLRLFETVYKMIEQEIPLNIRIAWHEEVNFTLGFRGGLVARSGSQAQNTAKKVETLFNIYKEKYFDVTFESIVDRGNKDLANVMDWWEKVKIPKCNKYCQTTKAAKIEFDLTDYMTQHKEGLYRINLMDFKVETSQKGDDLFVI